MTAESLLKLYEEHRGKVSDKWHFYLEEYDRILSAYREEPVRILEIGVQNGGSLEIWAKYFPNAQVIVGCDNNPKCGELVFQDERISVVIGDINANETYEELSAIIPEPSIIIDDGSHKSSDIIKTFARYFPLLQQGGEYIIEDLHCSYWQDYEGGLYDPYSSVSFFKMLADVINHEHWGVERSSAKFLGGFSSHYGMDLNRVIFDQVHSVEFVNSMCVVRKLSVPKNHLGYRVIAGEDEPVARGHLNIPEDQTIGVKPQNLNFWSTLSAPPSETLVKTNQRLAQQENQILELAQRLAEEKAKLDRLKQSRSWHLTAPLRGAWRYFNFNEKYYLENNPDVAASGMDAFEHYENYGQFEGRSATAPSLLQTARQTACSLSRSIRYEGGVTQSFRALVLVYKTEGIEGVKKRFDLVLSNAARNNYAKWIQHYESRTEQDRRTLSQNADKWSNKPLISILMPTYNTKLMWLQEAVESVRSQVYDNWELCIADDASNEQEVLDFLRQLSSKDGRIKIKFREQNGHISAASNSALEMCSGTWVALMDHDDLLSDHALFHVVDTINRNPDAQLLYSDEDKIGADGQRSDPYFKCAWNPDLFLSHNMISHLGVYKTELLRKIGGFRIGFEGSQDHDLALRYIDEIQQQGIHHIPRVLYHWRKHEESTASSSSAKPYAMIAGEKAIQDHFNRHDISASVEWSGVGYRVRYRIPEPAPLVTLIIPTRNGLDLLRTCVTSIIERTTYENYEIVIIDNGSDDKEIIRYFSGLEKHGNIRIIRDDRPFNYAELNNSAVKRANGEYIGLLNNDIEVIEPDWLQEMLGIAIQPGVGAVGAKLLYPDDTVQHAGVVLGIGGVGNHAFKHFKDSDPGYFGRAQVISAYSALTAACLIIKKSTFLQVGGFDEENLAIAFNDVDFCLRVVQAGYRNVWTPYARLYHHESATRGYEDTREKQARFASEVAFMKGRWGKLLLEDPAYSPNLTLELTDFSLAWPPRVH